MKRHWPLASLIEADEKARVAVLSRGLASAAEEGWRTPPARETGTGVVGFASASDCAAAEVTDDGDDKDAALVSATTSGALVEAAPRVTVTNATPQAESTVEDVMAATIGLAEVAATSTEVEAAKVDAGAVEDAGAAPEDPPTNVKAWLASPEAHAASSRTFPEVTAKQVPA